MFLQGYLGNREEVNNATVQKLQQNWTLNNFREMNGSMESWRSQDWLPHSRAFQERKSPGHFKPLQLALSLNSKFRVWKILRYIKDKTRNPKENIFFSFSNEDIL